MTTTPETNLPKEFVLAPSKDLAVSPPALLQGSPPRRGRPRAHALGRLCSHLSQKRKVSEGGVIRHCCLTPKKGVGVRTFLPQFANNRKLRVAIRLAKALLLIQKIRILSRSI